MEPMIPDGPEARFFEEHRDEVGEWARNARDLLAEQRQRLEAIADLLDRRGIAGTVNRVYQMTPYMAPFLVHDCPPVAPAFGSWRDDGNRGACDEPRPCPAPGGRSLPPLQATVELSRDIGGWTMYAWLRSDPGQSARLWRAIGRFPSAGRKARDLSQGHLALLPPSASDLVICQAMEYWSAVTLRAARTVNPGP